MNCVIETPCILSLARVIYPTPINYYILLKLFISISHMYCVFIKKKLCKTYGWPGELITYIILA